LDFAIWNVQKKNTTGKPVSQIIYSCIGDTTRHQTRNRSSLPRSKNIRQHRPNLLSQVCMSGLPPFHTATTDTRTGRSRYIPGILIELGNLQHPRPQPRGSHDVIENLLIGLQRCRTSRGPRKTIRHGTGVGASWSKDQAGTT